MTDTVLTCPNCGHDIPLNEALTAQLRGELEAGMRVEHETRLKQAMVEAEARARLQAEQAAVHARESADSAYSDAT